MNLPFWTIFCYVIIIRIVIQLILKDNYNNDNNILICVMHFSRAWPDYMDTQARRRFVLRLIILRNALMRREFYGIRQRPSERGILSEITILLYFVIDLLLSP